MNDGCKPSDQLCCYVKEKHSTLCLGLGIFFSYFGKNGMKLWFYVVLGCVASDLLSIYSCQ